MCQTTHGIEKTIAIEFLLLEFSLIIYSSDVVFSPPQKKLEFFRDMKSKFISSFNINLSLTYNLKYVHF